MQQFLNNCCKALRNLILFLAQEKLTYCFRRGQATANNVQTFLVLMEAPDGIEPSTFALTVRRSTAELWSHIVEVCFDDIPHNYRLVFLCY